jgi:formiminotetrahydrofolate cyclodeaminase
MLINKTIEDFLAETAAERPLLPAGGSSIALCAALASALTEFTANTTIGLEGYEDVQEHMNQISQGASEYRERFMSYMDEDAEAYSELVAAYRMPQETESEIKVRQDMISRLAKKATLVPLSLAQDTYQLIELIQTALDKGNSKATGDARTAYYLAKAAIQASINNVKINVSMLDDPDFTHDVIMHIQSLENSMAIQE